MVKAGGWTPWVDHQPRLGGWLRCKGLICPLYNLLLKVGWTILYQCVYIYDIGSFLNPGTNMDNFLKECHIEDQQVIQISCQILTDERI